MILFMTDKDNFFISGWNKDNEGNLWVTKSIGGCKKIAEGDLAKEMFDELCAMGTQQFPCIMEHKGFFKTNI